MLAVALAAGCQAPPPATVSVAPVTSPGVSASQRDAGRSAAGDAPAGASSGSVGDAGPVVLTIEMSDGPSGLKTMIVTRGGHVSITSDTNVSWEGSIPLDRIDAFRELLVREQICTHPERAEGLAVVDVTASFPNLHCTGHWADVGPLTEPTYLHFRTVRNAARDLVNTACQGKCPDFAEGRP